MTEILEVARIAKRYGSVRALKEVSFSVESGEIFGYLGPNGAGKTTTLRILLGLVRPDAGVVRLLGEEMPRARARSAIGFLPGELRLYGDLSAAATLDYFARYRRDRPPVLRQRLLEALGVEEAVLGRRVKFLSHGTKQKIGLVLAMQHDPDLLLLDEPTTGLDPLVQQAFRELVLDFARRGRAVLFSSHILSEVEVVCGRVAILRDGEIVAIETIESLRGRVIRKMEVRFEGETPPDLDGVAGVTRAEIRGSDATLWIQGDVNPVLRRIAERRVTRFVFPEAQLEDVFLGYYRSIHG